MRTIGRDSISRREKKERGRERKDERREERRGKRKKE